MDPSMEKASSSSFDDSLQEENKILTIRLAEVQAASIAKDERLRQLEKKEDIFDDTQRQLSVALKRIAEIIDISTDSKSEKTPKEIVEVDEGSKETEQEKRIGDIVEFPLDSPQTRQVEMIERTQHLRKKETSTIMIEEKSESFCESCEKLSHSTKNFAESLAHLGTLKLEGCLISCAQSVFAALDGMGIFLGMLKTEIREIFNKDIKSLIKKANQLRIKHKELRVRQNSYESSLALYLGHHASNDDDGNNNNLVSYYEEEYSSTKDREKRGGRSLSPSAVSSGTSITNSRNELNEKKDANVSSSSTSISSKRVVTSHRYSSIFSSMFGSGGGNSLRDERGRGRGGEGKGERGGVQRLHQVHAIDATERSKADCVQLRRQEYEKLRFEQFRAVRSYFKEGMLDLSDSSIAVFQFLNSFFKHGFHECTRLLESHITPIRSKINQKREDVNKKLMAENSAKRIFFNRLKTLRFETHTMEHVRLNIPGLTSVIRANSITDTNSSGEDKINKCGYLFKKGAGFSKAWRRRWFFISDSSLLYIRNERDQEKNHVADLVLTSVKEVKNGERPFTFCLINPQKSREYLLQAKSFVDMREWITALQQVQERKLYAQGVVNSDKVQNSTKTNSKSTSTSTGTSTRIHYDKISAIEKIRRLNPICTDCGRKDPVRSIRLDSWKPSVLNLMCQVGCRAFNNIYEAKLGAIDDSVKPLPQASKDQRKIFIRQKYVDKVFVKRTNSDEYSRKNECQLKAFKACADNDILNLLECYAQGFTFNTLDNTGATLLHIAARNGSNHALEFCLQNGCDATHKDNDNKTALMYSEIDLLENMSKE
eukprot:jgi/Bigna1/83806/fgenesh1_pg.115_\